MDAAAKATNHNRRIVTNILAKRAPESIDGGVDKDLSGAGDGDADISSAPTEHTVTDQVRALAQAAAVQVHETPQLDDLAAQDDEEIGPLSCHGSRLPVA